MPNDQTHQQAHHDLSELQRDLSRALDANLAQRQQPATPPPAKADATPARQMWGLQTPRATSSTNRITSPMEILVEVVDDAYRLRQQVEVLVAAITGEVPAAVGRMQPVGPSCGLLPNVARLASEIGTVQAQIARRIEQAMGRLS